MRGAFSRGTNASVRRKSVFVLTANASVRKTKAFALTANASIRRTKPFVLTANASIRRTNAFALTTNAFASPANGFASPANGFASPANALAAGANGFAIIASYFCRGICGIFMGIARFWRPVFPQCPIWAFDVKSETLGVETPCSGLVGIRTLARKQEVPAASRTSNVQLLTLNLKIGHCLLSPLAASE